ncbi:MAG: transcriptional regulator [Bacteroidales bacterium]|jgi:hypothetical protein|nr:transcriptional regulator [Bacteroidales bacterium]
MKTGEKVIIPQGIPFVGGKSAIVIKIEDNSFVGKVATVQTSDGEVYFDKEYQFLPADSIFTN